MQELAGSKLPCTPNGVVCRLNEGLSNQTWSSMLIGRAATITTTIHRQCLKNYANMATSSIPQADLESFSHHLQSSNRILALCGAGLSAASGLPTFRGAGGLWRNHDAVSLATPDAFSRDPGLVWQFYSYRRHMALQAQPNPAHYALAELAKRKRNFITLSQNVDGQARNDPRNYEAS